MQTGVHYFTVLHIENAIPGGVVGQGDLQLAGSQKDAGTRNGLWLVLDKHH